MPVRAGCPLGTVSVVRKRDPEPPAIAARPPGSGTGLPVFGTPGVAVGEGRRSGCLEGGDYEDGAEHARRRSSGFGCSAGLRTSRNYALNSPTS